MKEKLSEAIYTSIARQGRHSGPIAIGSLLKKLHYNRNLLNDVPQTKDEAKKLKYIQLDPDESKFHQFSSPGKTNEKYVSPDGHMEVVFDAGGNIVDDPRDEGTYNMFYSESNPLLRAAHGAFDVLPYYLWGNSPGDTTTMAERIMMSFE